jgi:hypothetical protein
VRCFAATVCLHRFPFGRPAIRLRYLVVGAKGQHLVSGIWYSGMGARHEAPRMSECVKYSQQFNREP